MALKKYPTLSALLINPPSRGQQLLCSAMCSGVGLCTPVLVLALAALLCLQCPPTPVLVLQPVPCMCLLACRFCTLGRAAGTLRMPYIHCRVIDIPTGLSSSRRSVLSFAQPLLTRHGLWPPAQCPTHPCVHCARGGCNASRCACCECWLQETVLLTWAPGMLQPAVCGDS